MARPQKSCSQIKTFYDPTSGPKVAKSSPRLLSMNGAMREETWQVEARCWRQAMECMGGMAAATRGTTGGPAGDVVLMSHMAQPEHNKLTFQKEKLGVVPPIKNTKGLEDAEKVRKRNPNPLKLININIMPSMIATWSEAPASQNQKTEQVISVSPGSDDMDSSFMPVTGVTVRWGVREFQPKLTAEKLADWLSTFGDIAFSIKDGTNRMYVAYETVMAAHRAVNSPPGPAPHLYIAWCHPKLTSFGGVSCLQGYRLSRDPKWKWCIKQLNETPKALLKNYM